MGRIKKTATSRHEATLSPALVDFIEASTSIPLYQLPSHLASFPRRWPFPRGDLYNWIKVLNRFDLVLELFNQEYGLLDGPQTQPFEKRLLVKGDYLNTPPNQQTLSDIGFSEEGDRELVEQILLFTRVLLENCGNRSLYSSSGHLNSLLNTTSTSLLKVTLRLSLRLAQRYHASRQRLASTAQLSPLLASHFNIDLEKVQKLALPFVQALPPTIVGTTPTQKGKDKAVSRVDAVGTSNAPDLVLIVKEQSSDASAYKEWAAVSFTYYESSSAWGSLGPTSRKPALSDSFASPTHPTTPTPTRRSSNLGPNQTPRTRGGAVSDDVNPPVTPYQSEQSRHPGPKVVNISSETILNTPVYEVVKTALCDVPVDAQYELLHTIRVAHALGSSRSSRQDMVAIRLLAIANLAYIHTESAFQQKISQQDSDQPRRLQLAQQLSELIHPPGNGESGIPRELQTLAISTLEALAKHKHKAAEVCTALSVNVNHGVLFYVVRKAVAELANDDDPADNFDEDDWREALFSLLITLPSSSPSARTGETMVAAGLLDILVEILTLRTSKAERNHPRVLNFLDNYVYNLRDAFQALINAKGLGAVADLTSYEVETSFVRVLNGDGMPEQYKTKAVDYKIPFYQQQTIRWLFKFMNHMLSHSNGAFDRLLRNLIDSPQLLNALRKVIDNAPIFGSNVWSGAVNILSSFIHNEPTSYQVIAEAGLSRSVLEAVTQTSIPEFDSALKPISTSVKPRLAQGILPIAETIQTVPHAFGAICLNESGMKLFQASGALEKFFEVFQSPAHVRALNDDQDAPTVLGSSFDELVRHHPPLKDIVLRSVMNMASKVALLSFNQASEKGAGAALWVETKEGKLLVAGGRKALSGHEPPHTARYEKLSERQLKEAHARANGTDVEMQDVLAPTNAGPSQSNSDFSFDDFLNLNPADGSGNREAAEDYVSVACRFLIGFFSNSSMCAAFCESGGIDILLNFATLPSYECNFYQLPVYDEIAKVIQQMVEQKPHLTLPSLIKRTQYAVDLLEPVVNHDKDFAYFSIFTDRSYSPPPDCLDWFEDVKSKGTLTVKSLTIVHTLCNILSSSLELTTYHHRSSHDLLSRVNLTDMYVQLVESLGKLHSACLWEEILMQQNVPESWKETTRLRGTGLGTAEANIVLDIITLDRRHKAASPPEPESGKRGNEDGSPGSTIDQDEDTAQHKNIDTLRYLLNQIPTVVMPLFQNVGKMLLLRRSIDVYQKQNAVMVAESLTSACLQQLQYPPPRGASLDDKCAYDAVSLTTLLRILIDRNGLDRGFPQALTLILQCFKNQGGFKILGEVLETYEKRVLEASSTAAHGTDGVMTLTMSCIKTILDLYSQVTHSKYITEAIQTIAMAGSNGARDRANPQYFLPAQFLVELRYAILPSVRRLWTSNLVDKATTSIVKCLIDTLRMVLDGDAEAGAYRRSDKLPPRVKPEQRKWKPKSIDQITTLTSQGFDENLAREALFRCNDYLTTAKEYCEFYRYDPTTTPNPIPKGEIQQSRSQNSPVRPVPDSNEAPSTTGDPDTADTDLTTAQRLVERLGAALAIPDDSLSSTAEAGNLFSASISNLLNRASDDAAEAGPSGSAPPDPSPSTVPRPENESDAGKMPDVVTIDDLNDERDILRKDLIDRCLDVLNVHNDVTFELAELISAAVSKAADPAGLRKEIGETIVQSLSSLQMEDDIRPNSRKIASYAHLVALVLQEKGYDSMLDELKENLPMLLAFLKPLPDRTVEESSPWVGYILLIIERLLEQDEQPNKIVFHAPTGDNPFEDQPLAEHKVLVVSPEARSSLFEAILLLLPQVGKDESLALSIVRVLVILTRTRTLATRLGEKYSMQRLFVMVKQLAGITNERLQSAFLLVLRHVVEDDATIRQIMRSEIQAHFTHGSGRDRRPVDTTNYTRNLYHLVLRQPEIFVEVTNEILELTKFDASQRPQVLSLKKHFSLQEGASPGDVPRNAASSEEKMKAEDTKPLTETKPEEDRSRGTIEVKPPVVENPDGVIHYLLSELLSYKDVEDKEQATPVQGHPKDPAAMDVDMTVDESTPTPGPSSPTQAGSVQPAAGVPEQKRSDKPEFKADQHPIYIYRCFILQCLTELLSCYNRTKVEFINFSRKADPQVMTPSKPRSGVLNYLLNALIPVGTISNAEDITFRKKSSTSNWAISVIVSLCSKTGEHGLANIKDRGFSNHEDEPELVYVRKFVLEHALKVYKEVSASNESLDVKYSRILTLSDLFNRMLTGKPNSGSSSFSVDVLMSSQALLAKIMYEKNFTGALTSSIADIDLNFPGAKRVVKYILRPLKLLTQTTIRLSESSDISSTSPGMTEEDEISSATSMSDMGEDREETPDLLRNSTLGMFDASREEESDSEGEDDDGEEMYDEEYDEGMEYDEEPADHDDVISDEDEEIEGMGPVEGMSGDVNMDLEIVVDGHEHDMSEEDEDDDEDEDSNMDDDDDDDDDMDDDIEAMGEVTGDDGDGSLADHEEEWEEEDGGIDYEGQEYFDDGVGSPHAGPLDHVVRVLNGDDPQSRLEVLDRLAADEELDMDIEQEYLEDEMPEDEDEDDEEDFDEEDLVYEPGTEDDDQAMHNGDWGWDDHTPPTLARGHHHHHYHHHRGTQPWMFAGGAHDPMMVPAYRSHRPGGAPRGTDDGTNPLLQRGGRQNVGPARGYHYFPQADEFLHTMDPIRLGRGLLPGEGPASFINQIINAMGRDGPPLHHHHAGAVHLTIGGIPMPRPPPGAIAPNFEAILGLRPPRMDNPSGSRTSSNDPAQAVSFVPTLTTSRWQDEARLVFGTGYIEMTQRVINSILRRLVPPALEAKRLADKAKEEWERVAAEEKVRREKAEKEKADREKKEKEEAEAEQAAARAREQAEAGPFQEAVVVPETSTESQSMEGVEPTGSASTTAHETAPTAPTAPVERVVIQFHGRELDITDFGIDIEYLNALPEELRDEVITAQVQQQRSQAQAAGEEPSEISREFLEALPDEIREELLRQEGRDRRQRERQEARRRAEANGEVPAPGRGPEEMDAANFLASLDPALRQVVLMEQDLTSLAGMPPEIQAEARALGGRRLHQFMDMPRPDRARGWTLDDAPTPTLPPKKPQRRQIAQILDKAGVATLLRLMFIPLQGSARQSLNNILRDSCENTQNRAEVVSGLLSILQDGSADVNAVERSFTQLSLRAKQPATQKTPQPLKRTPTGLVTSNYGDMSPLMVVQQCLSTLVFLTQYNPRIPSFFLTEHETATGFKSKATRKSKGKEKETKATKYPLNALLGLLDRKIVIESSTIMEQLADVLQNITHPLNMLLKKDKDKDKVEWKTSEEAAPATAATGEASTSTDVSMDLAAETDNGATAAGPSGEPAEPATADPNNTKEDVTDKKGHRILTPPDIPDHNLRLVVHIIASRECSSKTFRDTLSLITNLSAIPGAKEIFGEELIHQAEKLGHSILKDLEDLYSQISVAKTGTDVQGMALSKFSPASSDQTKFLRVLTALDYIFDPKRADTLDKPSSASTAEGLVPKVKEAMLSALYENSTFGPLWDKLSECLSAIRQRGNMFNVANILLPLVEALMVVCKNTTLKDSPINKGAQKEMAMNTPPPESRMENLFFTFTEEHRKILNDLVRHNPKLMSGAFSLLVKNSKVLEFDNKRNYFNRRLHTRTEGRAPHGSLQLNVRRDQVFLDSFKSLYFKSADEMKYGKLNIRFSGEEGVDAGGVTREWFAVLSRQMFNPDYVLFNPVASDRTTFHPNQLSFINPEHLMFFKFIGRIIGKALYEGRVLDCHFSRAVYKRILGRPASVKDMETLDLDYYKSLLWIQENDITDITFETFSVEVDMFGEKKIVDLKEDGRNIPVTEENKHEYVRLVVEQRLYGSVKDQLQEFLKGFHDIISPELISIFNEQELELLISGLPDIDVDDWKNNSDYHNYTVASPQIQWFWRAVRSFDKEERAKLLQFVTGTSKVPLNGFKELEGMNGFSRFNIHRNYGSKDRLPSSHTCFNQLDLPEYDSYEVLRQQVYTAMTAGSEYFGFA